MTSAQISSWLKGANAGCVSGRNCILNYTENTPTMAADAYCGRLEGKKGESAASVIARVGKACDISQKALLVLLEKEQSLVSLRDVPNWKWESATGYGCPDTAPCDAGFGGFFTQVYYGARAYQYYAAHPTQYRHQPMAMNSVLYNPNSACGSSRVYIENYATAGLYNYTPYQPNQGCAEQPLRYGRLVLCVRKPQLLAHVHGLVRQPDFGRLEVPRVTRHSSRQRADGS